ncbi:type II toxin-antitoxin system TacA family antitoxin [Acidithiobacillus ferriphilus]|uniref:type II toxin-antitoxin system TacA family antitoxin n=1 Tax=Acidithiobacillus ferriphilus TaxID=1689834 RepID=UPI00232B2116|nr:DUF1778 domain-containing protein [Acidithiobacillus ferriphilus]WCE93911.1 DUF1778 domain-containing protein [Acidithiobacillus ferriphilus]
MIYTGWWHVISVINNYFMSAYFSRFNVLLIGGFQWLFFINLFVSPICAFNFLFSPLHYVYGKLPYTGGEVMSAVARFDLKMDAEEKEVVSRAGALVGTTMVAFVRTAAKEKARTLLDRESRITMSDRDFQAFTMALDGAFTPNAALQNAIDFARKARRA